MLFRSPNDNGESRNLYARILRERDSAASFRDCVPSAVPTEVVAYLYRKFGLEKHNLEVLIGIRGSPLSTSILVKNPRLEPTHINNAANLTNPRVAM